MTKLKEIPIGTDTNGWSIIPRQKIIKGKDSVSKAITKNEIKIEVNGMIQNKTDFIIFIVKKPGILLSFMNACL